MATFDYKSIVTAVAQSLQQEAVGASSCMVPREIMTGILVAAATEEPTAMLKQVIELLGLQRDRAERAEAEAARCQDELHHAAQELRATQKELEDLRAACLFATELGRQAAQAEVEERIEGLVDAGRCAEAENDQLREQVASLEKELEATDANLAETTHALVSCRRHYWKSPNGTVALRKKLTKLSEEHKDAMAELTHLRARFCTPLGEAAAYDSDDDLSDVD